MKKILIINGPNLNLLGKREPSIYGHASFDVFFSELKELKKGDCELHYYQSNHEGDLIDKIHEVGFSFDGIVLNAGAYTHTSIALHDAIKAIETPVIEVHISNIHAREEFRHRSMIAPACRGSILGLGFNSYSLAIDYFIISNNTSI
ncbi:MAG: type II 3-dehydroquinate dehydratase [Dysgonomonas sp.]